MRNVSKWILVAAVCAGLGVVGFIPAAAQTAPKEQMPTADQIIDKYVKALGGAEAYQKIHSRVAKGVFEMEMMGGDSATELYQKAPNKEYSNTSTPQGDFKRGFNGTVGWQDNPMAGLTDVTGDQLADMKRGADFYGDIRLKEHYPKRTVKGKESVDGKDAYVVELTPDEGSPETWYFDVDSGLAVRVQATRETDNGAVDVDTTLSDYRDVDGIKFPFTVHQSLGQFDYTIKFNDVKQNVPIDDKIFDKPAE